MLLLVANEGATLSAATRAHIVSRSVSDPMDRTRPALVSFAAGERVLYLGGRHRRSRAAWGNPAPATVVSVRRVDGAATQYTIRLDSDAYRGSEHTIQTGWRRLRTASTRVTEAEGRALAAKHDCVLIDTSTARPTDRGHALSLRLLLTLMVHRRHS